MAALKQRHNKFEARVRVPMALRSEYDGRELLYKTLAATERRAAKLEASAWELTLKAEWAARANSSGAPSVSLRQVYDTVRQMAAEEQFVLHGDRHAFDEVTAGIEHELDRMSDELGQGELSDQQQAKVWALNDAKAEREGRRIMLRPELELSFRELADQFMTLWRTQQGLKETNTEQQKLATFDLFALYWGKRPIRGVRKADAASFVDALRCLDPLWAKSPKWREKVPTWQELLKVYGGRPRGLSDATVNRHLATLQTLWTWGQQRDHCEGNNPFAGFHRRLKDGRNVKGYQAWEPDELRRLFDPPPRRSDVTEVMLVAMFTGMRLDEIASLTCGQIMREGKVTFLQVLDAKTEAGVRRVPLHPQLGWLAGRSAGKPAERVWPDFNPEGPGKKAGADAGKEFSRFKLAKGFDSRRKAFHSFRKNFVGQMEERGVPENEVAQLVGHEKGFTFKKYGKTVSLARMAKIVAKIEYPGVALPAPEKAK